MGLLLRVVILITPQGNDLKLFVNKLFWFLISLLKERFQTKCMFKYLKAYQSLERKLLHRSLPNFQPTYYKLGNYK